MSHRKKTILLAIIVGVFWIASVGLRLYTAHVPQPILNGLHEDMELADRVSYRPPLMGMSPEYILTKGTDDAAIKVLLDRLENLEGTKTTAPDKREGLRDSNIQLIDVIYLMEGDHLIKDISFYEDGTVQVVDMAAESAKYYMLPEPVSQAKLQAFFPEEATQAKLRYYADLGHMDDERITCNWASHPYSGQTASTTALSDFYTWTGKRTVRPSELPPGNAETDDHYVFKIYGQSASEPNKSRTWEVLLFADGVTIDGTDHYVWADDGSVQEDLDKLLLRFAYGWHPSEQFQQ